MIGLRELVVERPKSEVLRAILTELERTGERARRKLVVLLIRRGRIEPEAARDSVSFAFGPGGR